MITAQRDARPPSVDVGTRANNAEACRPGPLGGAERSFAQLSEERAVASNCKATMPRKPPYRTRP